MSVYEMVTSWGLGADVPVPGPDFTWLETGDGVHTGATLRSIVGMVVAVALIAAGVALMVGIVGWIWGRAGGKSEKFQSFFGGMAGTALLAAVVLGGLTGATEWGAGEVYASWFKGGSQTFSPGGVGGDLTGEPIKGVGTGGKEKGEDVKEDVKIERPDNYQGKQ